MQGFKVKGKKVVHILKKEPGRHTCCGLDFTGRLGDTVDTSDYKTTYETPSNEITSKSVFLCQRCQIWAKYYEHEA